jgi:DNA mismatch repair protein MutS2
MTFDHGDPVHVASLGKGIVREARPDGRYLVEIKGRTIIVVGSQLTRVEPSKVRRRAKAAPAGTSARAADRSTTTGSSSLDLHGMTVHEALDKLSAFLNRALLDAAVEVRIIHGRSGGRIKGAVHEQLKEMPSIRGFRLDPRNAGVTIVKL